MSNLRLLLEQGHDAISKMIASQWDAMLSDDGLLVLREWLSESAPRSFSGDDKLRSFHSTYSALLSTALIRQHERVDALIDVLKASGHFYHRGRLLAVLSALVAKNAERGFMRIIHELADSDKLQKPEAKKIFEYRTLLAAGVIRILREETPEDVRAYWFTLLVKAPKPWSGFYSHFIDSVMCKVAEYADQREDDTALSLLDGWRECGFEIAHIALEGYSVKRSAKVLNAPCVESRLLFSALSSKQVRTIDWAWSWYSESAKARFIQRVSSNKSNKHELVKKVYKNAVAIQWLSQCFSDTLPRYLLKQISYALYTNYKRWVSRAKGCYEKYATHLYAPIDDPAVMVQFRHDLKRVFPEETAKAALEAFLASHYHHITFTDVLVFIRSRFSQRAQYLLDMYGTHSKSMIGLSMVTHNPDLATDILSSVPLSHEEKRQWLSKALVESEDSMVDALMADGADVRTTILPMHFLYVCKEGLSDAHLAEFWDRVVDDPKANTQDVIKHVGRTMSLTSILHTMPPEVSREALAVTANAL